MVKVIDKIENNTLYSDVVEIIKDARLSVERSINCTLIKRNWLIGERIYNSYIKQEKDKYGKSIINILAKQLTTEFGSGLNERNLYHYMEFYKTYPNILNALSSKTLLSWTHYRILLQVNENNARKWYEAEALKQMWSVRELQRNISSQYYERMLISQSNCKQLISSNKKLEHIKDPYVLEFLGLQENNDFLESDLELQIIRHIQKFMMELGKGYAFVSRQKRIHTEKEDYFIDLVFYNYILKCFVLIDIKLNKITHQDVGQMDMYIRMYDELIKNIDDNPTLGIILCSDTDEDIARYSVMNGNEQLFASKYKLYLPSEEELKKEIEAEQIFQNLKNK